jgi:hypothetical protein
MIYCDPITGYCQEIDRYLCSHTPGAYDHRGLNRPCIVNPNNVQTGNIPSPSQPAATSCFPTDPTDRSWINCQDDRDLTNWLYRELIDAATRNVDIADLRWSWKTILYPNPLALEGWASLVRDNHRFDFKHAIRNQFRSEIILFHTSTGLPYDAEYSVPGNIFYGYVGRSIGFWGWMLHGGAGWAEGTDPAHVGDPNRWTISVCDWELFGFYANPDWADTLYDDPDDYQAVELGVRLWDKYGRGMTESQLIRELEQNRFQLAPTPIEYGGNSYGWRNPHGWWPYKIGHFKGAIPSWLYGSDYGSPGN